VLPEDCGCAGESRNVTLPLSSACRSGQCGGCTGFTDGHGTHHCGHRCHWCPSGLHLRKPRPSGKNRNGND